MCHDNPGHVNRSPGGLYFYIAFDIAFLRVEPMVGPASHDFQNWLARGLSNIWKNTKNGDSREPPRVPKDFVSL